MSISIDYYFNSELKLHRLVEDINACLGCDLKPVEDDKEEMFDRFMSMELSFGLNTLINDGELCFEDFKYEIGIRNPIPDGDIRELQLATMAMIALLMYRRMGISSGILVYDIQRLLAKYEEKADRDGVQKLFDLISNEAVEIPGHLTNLYKLTESWHSSE